MTSTRTTSGIAANWLQVKPRWRASITRGGIARWTGEAGDPAGARDQYTALLPIQERVLGPEHPEILTTRANLANLVN